MSIIDPTKPETPQQLADSAPKVEIEQRLQVRRKGEMVINAWCACDEFGEFIDGAPFVNFVGQHSVDGVNPQTGEKMTGVAFDFPINNCADFDEAFRVFFAAKELHIKLVNTMNEMKQNQKLAQQAQAQRQREQIAAVNKAMGGRR
jgi:hypothetical protein